MASPNQLLNITIYQGLINSLKLYFTVMTRESRTGAQTVAYLLWWFVSATDAKSISQRVEKVISTRVPFAENT